MKLAPAHALLALFLLGGILAAGHARAEDDAHAGACGNLKTPEQYCINYGVTPSLRGDPEVQAGKLKCQDFFAAAIRAVNMVCAYHNDLGAVLGPGAGSQEVEADEAAKAKEIYVAYSREAFQLSVELERAFTQDGSRDAINVIAKKGASSLFAELECAKDGAPGSAPGTLLIGLARYETGAQTDTFQKVKGALSYFGNRMQFQASGTQRHVKRIRANRRHPEASPLEHKGAPRDSHADGRRDEIPRYDPKGAVQAPVEDTGAQIVQFAFQDSTAAGSVAGVLIKLFTAEQLDGLKLLNIGIGVVVGYTTAPFWLTVAAGIAVDVVEAEIRKGFAVKDAKITDPYYAFTSGKVDESSQELARAYRPQKEKADYCGKCNQADLSVSYCPARNKYNGGSRQWFCVAGTSGCHKGLRRWLEPDPRPGQRHF